MCICGEEAVEIAAVIATNSSCTVYAEDQVEWMFQFKRKTCLEDWRGCQAAVTSPPKLRSGSTAGSYSFKDTQLYHQILPQQPRVQGTINLAYSIYKQKWADKDEKVCFHPVPTSISSGDNVYPGGKAKPLKAPKKEKKDMDEEEIAFKAKQAAGIYDHLTSWCSGIDSSQTPRPARIWQTKQKARALWMPVSRESRRVARNRGKLSSPTIRDDSEVLEGVGRSFLEMVLDQHTGWLGGIWNVKENPNEWWHRFALSQSYAFRQIDVPRAQMCQVVTLLIHNPVGFS
jgi:Translation machinery associated TMA7